MKDKNKRFLPDPIGNFRLSNIKDKENQVVIEILEECFYHDFESKEIFCARTKTEQIITLLLILKFSCLFKNNRV